MKFKSYVYIAILSCAIVFIGTAVAAFLDRIKSTGVIFSVASADIKFIKDLAMPPETSNLADEITGPEFSNVVSNWSKDYPLKIYNAGTQILQLISKSNYTTAGDPDSLREILYVEIFNWTDANNNGVVDAGEKGQTLGQKTLLKWKTEGGINLGTIEPHATQGYILTFTTQTVSDTKQGKSGTFDFEFEGVGQ